MISGKRFQILFFIIAFLALFSIPAIADMSFIFSETNITTTGSDLYIKSGDVERFNFSVFHNETLVGYSIWQLNITVPSGFTLSTVSPPGMWTYYNHSLNDSLWGASGGNLTFENTTTTGLLNSTHSYLYSAWFALNTSSVPVEGNHTFGLYSIFNITGFDRNYNYTSIDIIVDNSLPNMTGINRTLDVDLNSSTNIWVNVTDAFTEVSEVFIEFNGANHSMENNYDYAYNYTTNFTAEKIGPGTFSFRFYANDSVGHWNMTPSYTLNVRTVNLSKISHPSGSIIAGEVLNLTFDNATDLDSVIWNNGTSYNSTLGYPWDINTSSWSAGSVSIIIWANDSWGKSSRDAYTLTVVRPALAVNSAAFNRTWGYQGQSVNMTVNVTGTYGVANKTLYVTKPDGHTEAFSHDAFAFDNTSVPVIQDVISADFSNTTLEGIYTMKMFFNDSEGNSATSTEQFIIYRKRTFFLNVSEGTDDLNVSFYFPSGSDPSAGAWAFDNTTVVSTNGTINCPVPDTTMDVHIKSASSNFTLVMSGFNITRFSNATVKAIQLNETNLTSFASNFEVEDSFAFELVNASDFASSFTVRFSYLDADVDRENALNIFKSVFTNYSEVNQINYSQGTYYRTTNSSARATVDTSANTVSIPVSSFSAFVLLEDTRMTEICDNEFDDDYDGDIDDGCDDGSGSGGSSGGGGGGGTVATTKEEEKEFDDLDKTSTALRNRIQENSNLEGAMERILGVILTSSDIQDIAERSALADDETTASKTIETVGGKSKMTVSVKYSGTATIEKFMVYDVVPKSFAESADEITVKSSGVYEVVEDDPEFLFVFDDVDSVKDMTIEYSLDTNVSDDVLDDLSAPVIFASLDLAPEEAPESTTEELEVTESEGRDDFKAVEEVPAEGGLMSTIMRIFVAVVVMLAITGAGLWFYMKRQAESEAIDIEAERAELEGASLEENIGLREAARRKAFEEAESPAEDELANIRGYISDNKALGRDVLADSLMQAGYDPDLIKNGLDEAFGSVEEKAASALGGPVSDTEQMAAIADYIDTYFNFGADKLRESLIASGYDPSLVDAEIAKRFGS